MTEKYKVNWKNYYQILQVSPDSDRKAIIAAYERLALQCQQLTSQGANGGQYHTIAMDDIDDIYEAYEALSDPSRRAAYDRAFKTKRSFPGVETEELTEDKIVDSVMSVFLESPGEGKGAVRWSGLAHYVTVITVILVLVVVTGAGSFAFAKPEPILPAPFRGIASTIGEASSSAISLLEEVRGVVATYERNIISTAIQSMRVIEDLRVVPEVTTPTNDMASFPSQENSLFADYLDKRFSQFRYTIDSKGIVSVDKSTATTDTFLEKIRKQLVGLTEEE